MQKIKISIGWNERYYLIKRTVVMISISNDQEVI